MLNSLAAGRQFAFRAVLLQLGIAVLAGVLAMLVFDRSTALALVMGASAVACGTALMAGLALGGGVRDAGVAFLAFVIGLLLKWVIVAVLIYIAIVVLQLNAWSVLAGLALALLVLPVAQISGLYKQ